jgi:3-oxocholest-4-en-26-oate---CoA ligase
MVAGTRRLTFSQLDARANRFAHVLSAAGVQAGDRVGLQLVNGTEYLEAMLGCFKIRAVPVNVNYRYVESELRYLYEDASLVGLVFHGRFAPAVDASAGAVRPPRLLLEVADEHAATAGEDYEAALARTGGQRDFPSRSADDEYCVYTGGTTGLPKGVLWRHEDIFFAAMGGGDALSLGNMISTPEELASRVLRPGMTALPTSPFMHASAHWLAFTTLFGGGKVVVSTGHFDAAATWRLVEEQSVNVLVVVGDAMGRPLIDELDAHPGRYDLSSLLAIGSGGAILSPSTKRHLARLLPGRTIVDAFGSSETGQLGGQAPDDDPFAAPRLHVDDKTAVLTGDLRAVVPGSGEVGLLARSGHIPVAYIGDVEKSAATFVTVDGRRWALPGDQATVEEDGTIVVLGRGSLCINTGGEKVFPDEVEGVLKEAAEVDDVVVVGVPDELLGERVVAVVSPRKGHEVRAESLQRLCHSRLAGYKSPKQVVVAHEIVRSPAGKPDYRWARHFALDQLADS